MAVESNLVVYEPRFVADVAAEFEAELARSRSVEPSALAGRPLRTRAVDRLARVALFVLEGIVWVLSIVDRWRPRSLREAM